MTSARNPNPAARKRIHAERPDMASATNTANSHGKTHQHLLSMITAHRAAHPDKRALRFVDSDGAVVAEHSFASLARRVDHLASGLKTQCAPGDRVLLMFPAGLSFIEAFLACLQAGCIAVPLYPPRNARHWQRLEHVLKDADATLGLCPEGLNEKITGWTQAEGATAPHLLVLDQLANLSTGDPAICTSQPSTLALLQYTSGSTGLPKGVRVTHGNLLDNLAVLAEVFRLDDQDVMVSWLPHFHDMGLVQGILLPLSLGCSLTLMAPETFLQRPRLWLDLLASDKATCSCAPNFAFDYLTDRIEAKEVSGWDLSAMGGILNGAEPIRAETLRRFHNHFAASGLKPHVMRPGYGMAETTLLVTDSQFGSLPKVITVDAQALSQGQLIPQADGRELVSVGRAARQVRLCITAPDGDTPLPPGQVGEVRIAGPSIADGYWQQSDATEATFLPRVDGMPFLRTGDLGVLDDTGELYICGRLKDVLIDAGVNHYPQDVEWTAQDSDNRLAMGNGAAVQIDGPDGQPRLVLIQEVTRKARHDPDIAAIFARVTAAISAEHGLALHRLVLVRPGSVPKTSSGKIQRQKCQIDLLANQLPVIADYQAKATTYAKGHDPATPEDFGPWLTAYVAHALAVDSAALAWDRPLAEYGMTSRLAVGLSGAIADKLGRPMPASLLYERPTLRSLLALGTSTDTRPEGQIKTQRQRGTAPTTTSVTTDIAIIGMACRFPGAADLDQFWQLLVTGGDAIGPVPEGRWKPSEQTPLPIKEGGFLSDIAGFDPAYFGIAPTEAVTMDPQQRLALEVSVEALEHAGVTRAQLRDHATGIYLGISGSEYGALGTGALDQVSIYDATGSAPSVAANRLSYALDLNGPSLAVDTACSSSLVAIHQAAQALQAGECEMAIAGGVNVMVRPDITAAFARSGLLSPDSRCRSFDAKANGYVRSEGCGMVVLKPLDRAQAKGDDILSVIKGSAIGHGGRSNGLTAPSPDAQAQCIQTALADAGLSAADIDLIETHGTGTPLGDPIEVAGIDRVFDGPRTTPVWLGSVKSNIGHLEAAAGVAGLIKTVLALKAQRLPKTVHLHQVNPAIPDRDYRQFATDTIALNKPSAPLRAGVSSFGFGGANAHMVIEAAPTPPDYSDEAAGQDHALRIAISAHTPAALWARAQNLAGLDIAPTALASRLNQHSLQHQMRTVVSVQAHDDGPAQLQALLNALAQGTLDHHNARPPGAGLVFVYSGQGSQWVGMGKSLIATSPHFAEICARLDQVFQAETGMSLLAVIEQDTALCNPKFLQPALCALQLAYTELLADLGVQPDAVLGHSLGEFAAAATAGAYSQEEAIGLAALRGRLMATLEGTGGLLAANVTSEQALEMIGNQASEVELAVENSTNAVVLSGPTAALDSLAKELDAQGHLHKRLPGTIAFHHAATTSQAAKMPACDNRIITRPFWSSVTGGALADNLPETYWRDNMRGRVRFATALKDMASHGYTEFLEIAPHPLLLNALTAHGGVAAGIAARDLAGDEALLDGLTSLYLAGGLASLPPAVTPLPRQPGVNLPNYPWQREPFWAVPNRPQNQDVTTQDADHHWAALTKVAEQNAGRMPVTLDLAASQAMFAAFDQWALAEMAACLTAIDRQDKAVEDRYQPLINRWRDQVATAKATGTLMDREAAYDQAKTASADTPWFLDYLRRCHDALLAVVTGTESSLQTLFPDGDWATVEQLYHQWAVANYFNDIISQTLALRAQRATPDQPLRILEIGAGTGGLTRAVLPALPPDRIAYTISDTSAYFANPLKQRVAGLVPTTRIEFTEFDLNQSPEDQGFAGKEFDIILAANAVHTAHDLQTSLSSLNHLLAPGGALMLIEATTNRPWHDTTIALIEDWSNAKPDGRSGSPLLTGQAWQDALTGAGFTDPRVFPEPSNPLTALDQSVIMAMCAATSKQAGKAPASATTANRAEGWAYRLVWQAQPAQRHTGPAPGSILVLGSSDLAARLTDTGVTVEHLATNTDRDALTQKLIASEADTVLFAPSESVDPLGTETCKLDDHLAENIDLGVTLLATYQQRPAAIRPRLWCITTMGARVDDTDAIINPAQAGILAWARGVTSEQPGCFSGLLDIAADTAPSTILNAFAIDAPDLIALRRQGAFTARLRPIDVPHGGKPLDPEALWLLTGASGVLSQVLARGLVDRGVRHLALLSRDLDRPGFTKMVGELETRGCQTYGLAVDCADKASLTNAISDLEGQAGRPVRALIHGAAVLDAVSVAETTPERIHTTLRPKAMGIEALRHVLANHRLDHCLLMGSASAVLAPPGHSLYAAANGYLEGVADQMRRAGQPAMTIHWGPWTTSGQQAAVDALTSLGVETIPEADGTALALDLLIHQAPQTTNGSVILAGEAEAWREAANRWLTLPILNSNDSAAMAEQDWVAGDSLEDQLRLDAASIMHLDPSRLDPHRPLVSQGLDSLMAIGLKGRIQSVHNKAVSITDIMTSTGLTALAAIVLGAATGPADQHGTDQAISHSPQESIDDDDRETMSI
ncbi:MAG: beta-ketoacyl synthase N-terminal-like domain-containing protein [Pseudomonadota bacterium]